MTPCLLCILNRIRQEVLWQIYSLGRIDMRGVGQAFGIEFHEYFESEWERLGDLENQGIVRLGDNIEVTEPLGRLLVRIPAAIFDRYLPPLAYKEGLPARQSSALG